MILRFITGTLIGIALAVAVLLFRSSGPALTTEELKNELVKDKGELRSSLSRVLPRLRATSPLGKHERGDHVVVIESSPESMDAIEVSDKLEVLGRDPDQRGIDLARWALFNADYPAVEKEQIFEKALEVLRPGDAQRLSRDVLRNAQLPQLFERALRPATEGLSREEAGEFLRELEAKNIPELEAALRDFQQP